MAVSLSLVQFAAEGPLGQVDRFREAEFPVRDSGIDESGFGVVEARANGVTPETATGADRWAALEARRTAHLGRKGRIHVMGLHGTISQRVGLLTGSGGTSTDEFGHEFDEAINDRDVGAVLIDVNSPGGSVFGVHELSQKIFEARGRKPIVAIANSEAYSAGYYVASDCLQSFTQRNGGWTQRTQPAESDVRLLSLFAPPLEQKVQLLSRPLPRLWLRPPPSGST